MALAWDRFAEEVARRKPLFWCRDDDAARPTPEFQRLLSLTQENRIPLAIAVVPELAQRELFETLGQDVSVLSGQSQMITMREIPVDGGSLLGM